MLYADAAIVKSPGGPQITTMPMMPVRPREKAIGIPATKNIPSKRKNNIKANGGDIYSLLLPQTVFARSQDSLTPKMQFKLNKK
jgi:hypothetical protein